MRQHTFASFTYMLLCFVLVVGQGQAAVTRLLETFVEYRVPELVFHAVLLLQFVLAVKLCLAIREYTGTLDRSTPRGSARFYAFDLLYYVCLAPALMTLNHYAPVLLGR